MGVFATRSPFRPNPIGLSCVKIEGIEKTEEGAVIRVSGADLVDGTPIYDIKPYLPFTDSRPEATGGFAEEKLEYSLEVCFPQELLEKIAPDKREGVMEILSQDPRPAYNDDPERVFGFEFGTQEIKFKVSQGILTVLSVQDIK